jgi:hypothetical protein
MLTPNYTTSSRNISREVRFVTKVKLKLQQESRNFKGLLFLPMTDWQLSKRRVLEVIRHSRNGSSAQIIEPSPVESSYEMFRHILPKTM